MTDIGTPMAETGTTLANKIHNFYTKPHWVKGTLHGSSGMMYNTPVEDFVSIRDGELWQLISE